MQWSIDPSHTSLDFSIRHMGISTVRGRFKKASGVVEATEDGGLTSVNAVIGAGSIDTGEAQRDDHLRSGDFLDVERYPEITFQSTAVERLAGERYRVKGDLTIHGQTRPVTLEVEASAPVRDPWGNLRAGASVSGRLNRKDWGLAWNQVLEFGALLVGEEVRFTIDVEAVRTAPVGVR